MSKKLKILFASYECAPFFKFGGLGDVAGSLPKALKKQGADIWVIMPFYRDTNKKFKDIEIFKKNILVEIKKKKIRINLYQHKLPGSTVPVYFIDYPKWFQVENIFDTKAKERFVLFSCLVLGVINQLKWKVDIIHCNDWQTALIPVANNKNNKSLKHSNTKTIYTIHNLAYKGLCPMDVLEKYGFDKQDFSGLDSQDRVNLMQEAILSADIVNTVSPTYAQEILTKQFGAGMENSLQARKKDLYGIVNGLDYNIFNPETDTNIKFNYNINSLNKKIDNKLYLQKISRLPKDKDIPIIGMVSRLAGQKGFDLVEGIIEDLVQENLQLIILGTGNKKFEQSFAKLHKKYKCKFKPHIMFSIELASQIYAGADMFLMPSKYEPCGLGQLIAMKYGTVPIVRQTGGLKDTVVSANIQDTRCKKAPNSKFPICKIINLKTATGFGFDKYDGNELFKTIKYAWGAYQDKKQWDKLVTNCINSDFSWDSSAKEYMKLYNKLSK